MGQGGAALLLPSSSLETAQVQIRSDSLASYKWVDRLKDYKEEEEEEEVELVSPSAD